jgi:NAD-dependent dihydropyrimidine dehydrogenase PreA subunit
MLPMTEIWYPIINENMCSECGECVAFCKRGVYDKSSGNKPVVINPDGCVDQCRNCGKLCPTGSITYMSDDSGWTPPNAKTD